MDRPRSGTPRGGRGCRRATCARASRWRAMHCEPLVLDESRTGAAERRRRPVRQRPSPPGRGAAAVHLLPSFDEYTVAYRDRRTLLHASSEVSTLAQSALLSQPVMVDGRHAGTWKRTLPHRDAAVCCARRARAGTTPSRGSPSPRRGRRPLRGVPRAISDRQSDVMRVAHCVGCRRRTPTNSRPTGCRLPATCARIVTAGGAGANGPVFGRQLMAPAGQSPAATVLMNSACARVALSLQCSEGDEEPGGGLHTGWRRDAVHQQRHRHGVEEQAVEGVLRPVLARKSSPVDLRESIADTAIDPVAANRTRCR